MCPQEHKGYAVKPMSVMEQESNSIKRYGVALMFLRAHGRKSMPVCLETLLFLCPFVLMFSALAANLIECHILQHPSSYLRLTQCYIALLLRRRGTCCCTSSRPRATAVNVSFVRLVTPLHFGCAVKHIIAKVAQSVHKADGLFCQTAVRSAVSCLRCAASVVAHAFLRLGCFSVFGLWFRGMSDSVYQFVNATFHNGIGIAQHSVKYSFHGNHTIWFDI